MVVEFVSPSPHLTSHYPLTLRLCSAGAAYVGSFVNLMRDSGFWTFPRGLGLLDGGVALQHNAVSSTVFSCFHSCHQERRFTRRTRAAMEGWLRWVPSRRRCVSFAALSLHALMISQFYSALLQGLGCQEQLPAAEQMDSSKCGRQFCP